MQIGQWLNEETLLILETVGFFCFIVFGVFIYIRALGEYKKTNKNRTLKIFWESRAVKTITGYMFLVYLWILLGLVSLLGRLSSITQFLQSFSELVAVFVGITLGFYWNKASERVSTRQERERILYHIRAELDENIDNLKSLNQTGWLTFEFLPQIVMWETYKERLSVLKLDDLTQVNAIYNNLVKIRSYVLERHNIKDSMMDQKIARLASDTLQLVKQWKRNSESSEEK
jgi:hypothetical protein